MSLRTLGALACAVALIIVTLMWFRARGRVADLESESAKLSERCHFVRVSIESDASHLKDPAQQAAAAARFLEPVAGHSYAEVKMCLSHPVDLTGHSKCQLARDFGCLAAMAENAARSIKENY